MSLPAKPVALAAKLRGKSLEEVRELTADLSREELAAILVRLVTVEPWYKPAEIAALRNVRRQDVLRWIREGQFGDHCFVNGANSLNVPASGVAYFDSQRRLSVEAATS